MKNNKNTIKINESQLRNMIAKSVKKILKENENEPWDNYEAQWIQPAPESKPVDENAELQPGWYTCEEGNYGNVSVWTTNNLDEVKEVLMSSESNVFGPYTEREAFDLAVNEVNNNKGFDFDDDWVNREFTDPADIEYFYSEEKWKEIDSKVDGSYGKNMADDFAKGLGGNVQKVYESQLRDMIAKSVKNVLKEQNTLLKNGYEVLNLVQAYLDDDSEQYIAMLKNMSEGCKKQVEEITGTTVDEMLSHWYAFHKAMIAIKKRYSELLTTGNNDGGYYDWH